MTPRDAFSGATGGGAAVASPDLASLARKSGSYDQNAGTRVDCSFVVVTGGVLSGLGKGITTSSLGRLLKMHGVKVTAVKIDPYLNIDAGTMNPFEHGEVFVLEDGGEVDLDLGNYERFLDVSLGRDNNITTGKAYKAVIERERRGDYLGKTVQIVPHVVNEIKEHIKRVAKESGAQVCLIEVGGTVGDIESMPFLEAVRQLRHEVGRDRVVFIHTTLVPVVGAVGEQKTKPTQHSIRELKSLGIDADVVVARSGQALEEGVREKISLFSDVPVEAVISAPDCRSIYEVPLLLHKQGLTRLIVDRLHLKTSDGERALAEWEKFVHRVVAPSHTVSVAIVGKYTHLADSYLSISEAFRHAGAKLDTQVKVTWVEATDLENKSERAFEILRTVDGILIPGGFGARGAEGKILAAKFARENHVPYLGICYGFQLALVEFARSVLGFEDANTTEVAPNTSHPVICILPEQHAIAGLGASMRLGASDIDIAPNTVAARLYGAGGGEASAAPSGTSGSRGGGTRGSERHRHRYEVNPDYMALFEGAGMVFSGRMPGRPIMEIMELPDHPYFVGGQFHPEFKSRPERPAPVFAGFVEAALAHKQRRERGETWKGPTRGPPNASRPPGHAREALAAR